jgi:predicted TIM-barrel fold metal-dependent hydrolase
VSFSPRAKRRTQLTINDAHCHFFSPRFFEALGAERHGAGTTADRVAAELGWEPPGQVAVLAQRWVGELERNHVSRAALIASVPGDEESVAAAVRAHPGRFVGFFVINPLAPGAVERARHAFGALGLQCACLFAALHRYALDSEPVRALFEVAQEHNGAIFAHCGYLSIEARVRLGLPSVLDLRCGDPLALAATAVRFPRVPVIVPHFGAGFFREALMAAESAQNIFLDTSSSNSWIKYHPGLTLTDVFRQSLAVLGSGRLVFGTDSSFFPRGWRRVIMGAQRAILGELGTEAEDQARVFGGNFDRLFQRS